MRSIYANSIARFIVILVVMSGWFVLSNHCALGMIPKVGAAHQCCENGKFASAEDQPAQGGTIICCKALQALSHDTANVSVLKPNLAPVLFATAWLLELERQHECRADLEVCGDTAPPLAISFSELVLQRSLLAHAPPALT